MPPLGMSNPLTRFALPVFPDFTSFHLSWISFRFSLLLANITPLLRHCLPEFISSQTSTLCFSRVQQSFARERLFLAWCGLGPLQP